MFWHNRPSKGWLLALAFIALAAGCTQQSSGTPSPPGSGTTAQSPAVPKLIPITYAMPNTIGAIPAYVAADKGFWKQEGLDVKVQMFSSGRLALDALLGRSAEVMSVSETPLLNAMVQGRSINIIATVTDHQEVKCIARTDHGINKPADLKGKRVATLPGTNSDYFMYRFLSNASISPSDVKITSMQPPQMVASLLQGDIDAYFAWEPHIFYARKQLGNKTIVFNAGNLYRGKHCVAMNQDYTREHPEVAEKLVRGFVLAEQYIKEHPAESMAIVAKRTGMDLSALKTLWPEYKVNISLDSSLLSVLNSEALWLHTQAKPPANIPQFRSFIYPQALMAVRPASVHLTK